MKLQPRPGPNCFKYTDLVSYISFAALIPIITFKTILFTLPVGLNLFLSHINADKSSACMESIIRNTSLGFSHLERWIGWGTCILLTGIIPSVKRYSRNKEVVKEFVSDFSSVDFSQVPVIHRHAIEKEGFFEIWFKNTMMWSLLPPFKVYSRR